jgi:hypothetical protein
MFIKTRRDVCAGFSILAAEEYKFTAGRLSRAKSDTLSLPQNHTDESMIL